MGVAVRMGRTEWTMCRDGVQGRLVRELQRNHLP
jgi:hypothetical protein